MDCLKNLIQWNTTDKWYKGQKEVVELFDFWNISGTLYNLLWERLYFFMRVAFLFSIMCLCTVINATSLQRKITLKNFGCSKVFVLWITESTVYLLSDQAVQHFVQLQHRIMIYGTWYTSMLFMLRDFPVWHFELFIEVWG